MTLFQKQRQEGSQRSRLRREPGAGDPRRLELAEPEATQPDELEGEERAPREREAKAGAGAGGDWQRQREEAERCRRMQAERQRQKPETLAAVGGEIELAQTDPGRGILTAALESIEALVSPELMLTRALARGAGANCLPELVDEVTKRLPSYEDRHAVLLEPGPPDEPEPPHELVLLGPPCGQPADAEGPLHPTLRDPADSAERQALRAARRLFDYQRTRLHKPRPIRPDVNSMALGEPRRLAAQQGTYAGSRELPQTADPYPKARTNPVKALG